MSNKNFVFFKKPVTFTEFVNEIKSYIRWNFADPKGEHLKVVKEAIRKNGFNDPEAFLNKYIWERND